MLEVQSDPPAEASDPIVFSIAAHAGDSGRTFRDRLKRGADFALAAALLLVTLPLCGFVCLTLKLASPGPIFSQQLRLNAGPRCRVLRFRTPETTFGEFLRNTRIEDLPLLIYVLRGEMTLVGSVGKPYAFDD